ncbi:MAG: glycosyltransferase family 9 protein [Gemmatimonadota bacterium]
MQLTVVTGPRSVEIARHHPAIDRVLLLDRRPDHLARFLARLLGSRFDIWLDPKDHASGTSRSAARLARAALKIGFNGAGPGPFDIGFVARPDEHRHFAEIAASRLTQLGHAAPTEPRLSVGLSPEGVRRASSLLEGAAPHTVLVNISAGAPTRYWPLERWIELLPRLAAIRETTFLLSSAPEDADDAARLAVSASAAGLDLRRLPSGTLLDVAAVVSRVTMVLSVDTAIVHLAAALDRPIVALYYLVPTAFERFHPLSRLQEVATPGESIPLARLPVESVERSYRTLLQRLSA